MLDFNEELFSKAKGAENAVELLDLAKEHNIELTEEEAEGYFLQLNPKTGQLSDEELDNVAGGSCYTDDGDLVVTLFNNCEHFELDRNQAKNPQGVSFGGCSMCEYRKVAGFLKYICVNPKRRRG